MVGNDLDQAPVLVSAGKRIAIESEAGKVSQALADAVREPPATSWSTTRRVRTRSSTRGPICARRSASPSRSRARTRGAKIVFPVELVRAGIAGRLPPRVRRRAVFATSAPERDADFEAAFKQHFGRTPDPYARLGYQAMQRVLKAIGDAGGRAHLRSVVADRYFQLPPVKPRLPADQLSSVASTVMFPTPASAREMMHCSRVSPATFWNVSSSSPGTLALVTRSICVIVGLPST